MKTRTKTKSTEVPDEVLTSTPLQSTKQYRKVTKMESKTLQRSKMSQQFKEEKTETQSLGS